MQMLFLLFKKEITKTFKLNYLKRGNVSQRNKIMASYIAVGVAFVFFLVRWIKLIFEFRSYNWMEEEIVPFLLTPVISVSVFLALIVGFFGGSGLIFFDKNYEAEYSWPVAVEITVVSKMLVPYFVLVLVDIALIGPLITLYGAVRAISIFFVLAAAVELLLLPVVEPFDKRMFRLKNGSDRSVVIDEEVRELIGNGEPKAFEDFIRNDYMNYFNKLKLLQYLQQHDVIRFI